MRTIAFVLFALVFWLCFLAGFVGFFAETIGHPVFLSGGSGVFMFFTCVLQVIWGVPAGIISAKRGWRVGGVNDSRAFNAFNLVVVSIMFAAAEIILAANCRIRFGKFLPAPDEC